MCTYNSRHVADFVGLLKSGDLRLDPVLPALEKSGVIDAAVVLLARDGLVQDAMDRLIKHLGTLEKALIGLIAAAGESPDVANAEETAHDLLENIQKYVKVGIWLSQGQTKSTAHTRSAIDRRKSAYGEVKEADLAIDELLWLDLISTVVKLIKETSTAIDSAATPTSETLDTTNITKQLRDSVQQTFSALLASTTIPPAKATAQASSIARPGLNRAASQSQTNPSFLRILRAFLHRAATTYSPSLTHLRSVLAEIFAAYTFEERILQLANSFLDKEGFAHVSEIAARRSHGWRPRGQVCEGCRARTWGPGAGSSVWDAWERSEEAKVKKRAEQEDARWYADRRGSQKGKQKSASQSEDEGGEDEGVLKGKGPLVVFACRHLWHKSCVEAEVGEGRLRCPLCVKL